MTSRATEMLAILFLFAPVACGASDALPPAVATVDDYVIGIDDQVLIRIVDLPDVPDKPFRVDPSGSIDLPLLGPVHAADLTLSKLKQAVATAAGKYITDPQISVNVVEYHSQPVSVIGAVNNPGVHSLAGPKRLIEVLSEAGGLRADAGSTIRITREMKWDQIPLPNTRLDAGGQYSVAELDTDKLMNAGMPRDNILVRPHDVISVGKAELVYVMGNVRKAGGFTLASRGDISVLKALSLAEGPDHTASTKNARILRPAADGVPEQNIPVDVAKILAGKARDVPMRANDVLYIPNNAPKSIALRSAEAALQIGTGLAIYH
jgi:polysaccharide export outer membrane protein